MMSNKCERNVQKEWLWTSLIISAIIPRSILAGDWVVHVPVNPILAPSGSSVTIPCTYDFPDDSGSHHTLSEMWCLNQSRCITPAYVYHSDNIFPDPAYLGRVQYLGLLGSKNCSIRISNLKMKDSGVYVFRFITDHPVSKLPDQKGVILQVTAEEQSSTSTVAIVVAIIVVLAVIATIVACIKRHAASKSLQTVFNDDGNL